MRIVGAAINGFIWSYIGNAFRLILQFSVGVLLARILGPNEFGLVAVIIIVLSIGKLVSDLGLTATVIQKIELSQEELGSIFVVQVVIGIIIGFICFCLSDVLAKLLGAARAAPYIKASALVFVLQGVSQPLAAFTNRNMNFKLNQFINIIGYIVGYVVFGLGAAYLGFGAWALVLAQLIQSLVSVILLFRLWGGVIEPNLKFSGFGGLSFGGQVSLSNIINWLLITVDSIIISRIFGEKLLGIYNRASMLASTPLNAFISSIQTVLFSFVSRTQNEKETIKKAIIFSAELVSLVSFPIFIFLGVYAAEIIDVIYGDKWLGAGLVFRPLAFAMPFYGLMAISGPALSAIKKVKYDIFGQGLALLIAIPAIYISCKFGFGYAAWAIFFVYLLRMIVAYAALGVAFGFIWHEFLVIIIYPFAFSVMALGFICGVLGCKSVGLAMFFIYFAIYGIMLATRLKVSGGGVLSYFIERHASDFFKKILL